MTGRGDPRTERASRERLERGLDALRTLDADELLRRRIWGRVASPPPDVQQRRPAPRLVLGSVVVGLVGATVFIFMARTPRDMDDRAQVTQTPPITSTSLTSEGTLKTQAPPSPPLTLAPTTLRTGADEQLTARLPGDAWVVLSARTELELVENGRPELHTGRVHFDVPPQPSGQTFEIRAGHFVVRVIGTRFVVERTAKELLVSVEEGRVEVVRGGRVTVVGAGQTWRGGEPAGNIHRASSGRGLRASDMESATGSLTSPITEADLARAALAAGDFSRALVLFTQLSRGSGPVAENALYETGRVLFDHLGRPRDALRAWRNYRVRFPSGLLRVEVDLSIVEALAQLGDRERAIVEGESFLERYETSERRGEVSELVRALREGHAIRPR